MTSTTAPGAATAQIALQVERVTHVMEQAGIRHSVKFFRSQGNTINTIGQRGMPKNGLPGKIEHRIGAIS